MKLTAEMLDNVQSRILSELQDADMSGEFRNVSLVPAESGYTLTFLAKDFEIHRLGEYLHKLSSGFAQVNTTPLDEMPGFVNIQLNFVPSKPLVDRVSWT